MNYTIIIPRKNTPGLLRKCLETIPQRGMLQCDCGGHGLRVANYLIQKGFQ